MGTAPAVGKSYFGRLTGRYRDGYSVAMGTVRFGKLVRLGSLILGGTISIAAARFLCDGYDGEFYFRWFRLLAGIFVGVFAGAVGYISGTFLIAQGQFMSALLDIAVNTSPHLQDSEKASIMML